MAIDYSNHYTVRRDLVIYLSEDSGATWEIDYNAFLGSIYEAPFNTTYNPYSHLDTQGNIHIADIGGNSDDSEGIILCYNYNGVQKRTYIDSPSYGMNFTYFVLSSDNNGIGKLFVTFTLPSSGECQLNVYTFNLGVFSSVETFNLGSSFITPTAAKYIEDENKWFVTIGTYLFEYTNGSLTEIKSLPASTQGAIITDKYVIGITFTYDIDEDNMLYVTSSGSTNVHSGVSKNYRYNISSNYYNDKVYFDIYKLTGELVTRVVVPWGNDLRGYEPGVPYDAEFPLNTCVTSDYVEFSMFMITKSNLSDVVDGPTDVMFVRVNLGVGSALAGPHKHNALKTTNKYGHG